METYIECLVKRKRNPMSFLIKGAFIFITVLFFLLGLMNVLFFVGGALMVFLDYMVFLNLDIEYEYLYVNGELSIDKILAKSKRKSLMTFNVHKISLLVPVDAPELMKYKNSNLKKLDYSSGYGGADRYVFIYNDNREQKYVVFEPDEVLLGLLKSTVR